MYCSSCRAVAAMGGNVVGQSQRSIKRQMAEAGHTAPLAALAACGRTAMETKAEPLGQRVVLHPMPPSGSQPAPEVAPPSVTTTALPTPQPASQLSIIEYALF
jgi:hypothetical protein